MSNRRTSRARQLPTAGNLECPNLWHLKQHRGFGMSAQQVGFRNDTARGIERFVRTNGYGRIEKSVCQKKRLRFSVSFGETEERYLSRLTGASSLLPPVYSEAWAKDNMLTKYQLIKFIDICEVWFLPVSVAAIVGDHPATRLGIDSKTLTCSWGTADQAASTRCQS
ncbi:hypothetical protein TNCV_797261 [Trichonephila clavipes]|uniref:Uncharacterized protein n=1 Tax=Trichonephila clavipes TaxID=2585209 RepID=A0A8X6WHV1_TRICX|nr:hypothetical protein TNCV_797261 [Trichonephila clavipes]